jgi:peptide-methionine (R)-S-oxide reductase
LGRKNLKKPINKSEKEWKKILTKEEYYVLRKKGTEKPFSGKYYKNKENGTYVCAGCGNNLFKSDEKYESGTGWPSFSAPISEKKIKSNPDYSLGIYRTEVVCSVCGGHLGHVFNDGPMSKGKRFCINSIALRFKKT